VDQRARPLNLTTHASLSPIQRGFAPSFVNYKKGALDLQPQVIKFTRISISLDFSDNLKRERERERDVSYLVLHCLVFSPF
jgi:hypothetical protein